MSDSETPAERAFDPRRLFGGRFGGHGGRLGIVYHDHGDAWAELALPYHPNLVGDEASGIIALYRDIGGYPEPHRTSLRDLLRRYVDEETGPGWRSIRYWRSKR